MIHFGPATCGDLQQTQNLEWLETNGLGGFASSTITGLNTRRYHGLLVAATKPPVGRMVLLSKLEETLVVNGVRFDLSANQYAGAIHPQGQQYLNEFRLDPYPTAVYRVSGIEIEKRVFMIDAENTTVIEYTMLSGEAGACVLELRPLIAFRDYHATTHKNDALNGGVQVAPGLASVTPYAGLPTLFLAHNAQSCESTGNWYFNFEYAAERERGLEAKEDLFNPLVLRYSIEPRKAPTVIASTSAHDVAHAPALRDAELLRRRNVVAKAPSADPLLQSLTAAADQFIVQRGQLNSVIAGYHWFTDWGRDTMISLPGLTLMTGKPEVARKILQASVDSADQGMLPNRFPDGDETPEYNTVDATLWLFEAVRSYLFYTDDQEFVLGHLYTKLKSIIDWYMRGARFGIHAGDDGLLWAGEAGVQLTWMDSKIGDWVVTPRTGKPVEIQALWYNAIYVMGELARASNDSDAAHFLTEYAGMIRQSFNAQFWNAQQSCLYDVVGEDGADASIRPNQIFALSLHHRMVPAEKERMVLDVVERDLLTPLGLRTLSPSDAHYRPHYQGGVSERDSSYHQGTVWPWLMGPFLSAYVRIHERSPATRAQAEQFLKPFAHHLSVAGLGQVSEILDGDPPHQPRGCIAQAWSVAELLRAAVEDVYEIPLSYKTKLTAAGKEKFLAGSALAGHVD